MIYFFSFLLICLSITTYSVVLYDVDGKEWKLLLKNDDDNGVLNCGKSDDLFQIEDIFYWPKEPVRGKNLHLSIEGCVNQIIPQGSFIELCLKVGGITLFDGTLDLCEQLSNMAKSDPTIPICPVQTGIIKVKHSEYIPSGIPKGTYHFKMTGFTPDNSEIFCLCGEVCLK